MKSEKLYSRRTFIKTSSLAALLMTCNSQVPNKPEEQDVFQDDFQINPYINNLRVACCSDTNMISGTYGASFKKQNNAIETHKVETNMDEMAKALAETNTASDAWETIFQKPDSKTWNQVKCAIKVNCINTQIMPRIAIVGKICNVLISLGVSPSNIVVYDGCSGASGNSKYTPYIGNGLPSGVIVSSGNSALTGTTSVKVNGFSGSRKCTADIANGVVDILVNCAVNKGHSSSAAGITLCMKNHFGTFNPCCSSPGAQYRIPYIIAINKHEAILGGNPARQQLCIMDSLWAAVNGPGGPPSHEPAMIVMGTFAPAVDYLTAKKIRQDVMGVSPNSKIDQFLTEFGYTRSDYEGLDFVMV